MWVIGTDGGYLDAPVLIDPNSTNKAVSKRLTMMPGERYDVIIDFNDPIWLGLLAARGVTFPLNTLELENTARIPFPDGAPAPKNTHGRLIQFRVSGTTPASDTSYDPASGVPIRTGTRQIERLVDPAAGTAAVTPALTRQLTLNEVMGPGGPLEVLVNNSKWSGHSIATDKFTDGVRPDFSAGPDDTLYSELPNEGDTELWEIINLTVDSHPIHLHLVQFQLMNRQRFDVKRYQAAYDALFPGSSAIDPLTGQAFPQGVFIGAFGPPLDYATGKAWTALDVFGGTKHTPFQGGNPNVALFLNAKKWPVAPPLAYEAGWKDTVIAYPGEVTRIMVRWAPTDTAAGETGHFPFDPNGGHGYVWHCHIIDHEDNEMMRPDMVNPITGAGRDYAQGTDY